MNFANHSTIALLAQILAGAALLFSVAVFAWRLRIFNALPRPKDRSVAKGSPSHGILYAFTLGMAPWSKESTRLHAVAYLRGVAFHLGIFLTLALLVASPWIPDLPASWRLILAVGCGLGALFGLAGFLFRRVEHTLKKISTPDDYAAVLFVSLFMAAAALWLVVPASAPAFYLTSALMLVYATLSKIRHCIYFAFSRLFFGTYFGKRAVLPHGQQASSPRGAP